MTSLHRTRIRRVKETYNQQTASVDLIVAPDEVNKFLLVLN